MKCQNSNQCENMRFCRRYIFKAWIPLLLIVYILYIGISTFRSSNLGYMLGLHSDEVERAIPKNGSKTSTHVIISSYMRSGSSFVGRLVGFRPDAFYIYEPLWKYGEWAFYETNTKKCDMIHCRCRNVRDIRRTSSVTETLLAIGKCQEFKDVVAAKMTPLRSGVFWRKFIQCLHRHGKGRNITNHDVIPTRCILNMQQQCLNYTHVVSKVLRLSPSMYGELLQKSENIKIIHLFRDPRAIINSRLKTKWYPVLTPVKHAKCLCEIMLSAYQAGLQLLKQYPRRFRFIFYEDLLDGLKKKSNKLYNYLGMTGIRDIGTGVFNTITSFGYLSDHSRRDKSTDFAEWWRSSMRYEAVRDVDNVCADVYKLLGYQVFENETELRDRNYPSHIFPSEFKL